MTESPKTSKPEKVNIWPTTWPGAVAAIAMAVALAVAAGAFFS